MSSDDMALVREYAQSNSELAFATLVSRHVNLVYSVALQRLVPPNPRGKILEHRACGKQHWSDSILFASHDEWPFRLTSLQKL
jgi:hypothetical protein